MSIKHMPSGLFPHFDSALERRPFFVQAGESVRFGCRLDSSDADSVQLEITDSNGKRVIPGQYHSTNDREQRYFHFIHQTAENDNTFTYRFVTSDHETSKEYECPVLREVTLYPEIATSDDVTYLTFRTDTQEYRIEISSVPCIRINLTCNLTVKIENKQDKPELSDDINSDIYITTTAGTVAFRIKSALTLMLDEKGNPHNIRMHTILGKKRSL